MGPADKATVDDVEKFNTNNSWGFGGGVGTRTTYDNGYYMRKGVAYFRHHDPERFCRYYDADGVEVSKSKFFEECEHESNRRNSKG